MSSYRYYAAVVLLIVFGLSVREAFDPDMWWHLRTGQLIVETHHVPRADPYSFTNPGSPWVAHEWLSEVIMAITYNKGGFPALILLFALLTTAALALCYSTCEGPPLLSGAVVLLGALAIQPFIGIRPQVISLVLFALTVLLLERYASGKSSRIWLLVPLTVLWVNLHAAFPLVLFAIGLYGFGTTLDRMAGFAVVQRATRKLALVFAACVVAVAANPNGFRMYLYPLETLRSAAMQQYIMEWRSPDFHRTELLPLLVLLLGTIFLCGLMRRRLRPTSILLVTILGFAALRSARHAPLFALAAVPVCAQALAFWIESRSWSHRILRPSEPLSRRRLLPNTVILIFLVGIGSLRFAKALQNQRDVESQVMPGQAVNFILANDLPGSVFNAYDWGGYLVWRLYPKCGIL